MCLTGVSVTVAEVPGLFLEVPDRTTVWETMTNQLFEAQFVVASSVVPLLDSRWLAGICGTWLCLVYTRTHAKSPLSCSHRLSSSTWPRNAIIIPSVFSQATRELPTWPDIQNKHVVGESRILNCSAGLAALEDWEFDFFVGLF